MNIKKIAITSINFLMIITFMISIIACDLIKTPTSQEVSEETIIETITIQAEKADDFTVSTVFSDNMIVQRNERLRIFGFANENQNNKKIVADFMGMHSEGLVENGKWEIVFPHGVKENLNTDGINILEVKSNTKKYSFKNILIGDVYMIIGQSNVAYSLLDHFNYLESLPLEQAIVKGDSSILNKNAPIRINYNGLDQETTNYVRGSVDVCKEPSASSYKGWQTPTIENSDMLPLLNHK